MLLKRPELQALSTNLYVDSEKCGSDGLSLTYAAGGILNNMETVCAQFVAARSLQPLRIAILSPPGLEARAEDLAVKVRC